ncbi:MAG: MBOAT family protein [Kiritimatiellae bacterium]|nr:MBOAT family protein [Kiritimatiellia bacterium]
MTFVSLEFAVLLICTLAAYYFLPRRARQLLLLGASYVFYTYWNPIYGLLILASTLVDYAAALAIDHSRAPAGRRLVLILSIVVNLGILFYFKYTHFALDSLRALLGPLGRNLPSPVDLILPVGISFYTFQTMSYTIDVYRGKKRAEKDFILVALYVAFFPQLVAGPIERAKDLMPQLGERHAFRFKNIEHGFRLILWGLLKKAVVGDRLIQAAYGAYLDPAAYTRGELAFSAVGMLVAIYLDFSAYSEIARGTAQLFGIRLSRNFLYPHAALTISDFWRRWHMTMSSWVHDYLFVPLGGSRPRNFRHQARTILTTMGLVGLWHGAQWTFVFWGLAHGLSIVLHQLVRIRLLRRFRRARFVSSRPWLFGSWLLSTATRALISILFFSPSIAHAGVYFRRLCFGGGVAGFDKPHVLLGLACIAGFWVFHYLQSRSAWSDSLNARHPALRALAYSVLFYIVLFGAVDTSEPFIYFQF